MTSLYLFNPAELLVLHQAAHSVDQLAQFDHVLDVECATASSETGTPHITLRQHTAVESRADPCRS